MAFIEFERSVKESDWSMAGLHSHSHYEIYFLSKGSRSFFLSDALYRITAPAIVIVPPRAVHKTEGGWFERHNVNVAPEYLTPFQSSVLESNSLKFIKLSASESKVLLNLFDEAYKIEEKDKFCEQKKNAVFSFFVYKIAELDKGERVSGVSSNKAIPPTVLKVLDYLNQSYGDKITLDGIAERFFMSKTTLIYNFKRYVGQSPIDLLLTIRLTNAKKMLVSTKKSVGEISDECGFSSANYFGLIFKKKQGISPLEYRKLQLSKI